jgi:calcineurin-like phosphoesterase family protein
MRTDIFITSDTHFHHKNIVRGTTGWRGSGMEQKTRDFPTLEAHDETLVKNINDTVGENDILYHLGDWSFGGLEQVWEFRKRLNCLNIHIVYGNHDHHLERNRIINVPKNEKSIVERILGREIEVNGDTIPVYIHDMFSSLQPYKTASIGGQSMVLCHYAMRTWDKGHHGTWMLYGHSHGTLPPYHLKGHGLVTKDYTTMEYIYFKTMDVGVDTHPEFRPYHIDEIRKIMEDKSPLLVDHHNENTN